jgi:hypothetical protein
MHAMSYRRLLLLPVQMVILVACARAAADRGPLAGTSKTQTVRGEYNAVAIDQVDGMALREGKLALRGPQTTIAVDLPPSADATKPGRGWALVTETSTGGGRSVTFTHETTLDDFTLELPASDAPLRYGSLAGTGDEDVLVFAWGEDSQCFWGYVIIARK